MNTRFIKVVASVILVVTVAASAAWLSSHSNLPTTGLSNTGISFPANAASELDLGQQDEQAKLEDHSLSMPFATGELDLGQQDERAKLGIYH